MDKKALIKKEALRIGIDIIGFTSCMPLNDTEDILRQREMEGYLSGFEEKDIKKRTNPSLIMEDCKTIISGGISYNVEKNKVGEKNDSKYRCSISRSAWGTDYHIVLKSKLNELSNFLRDNLNGDTKVFVDTGPLVEREIARRAGMGYIGKNCSLINPRYGSYIFIGEILTNLYIEPDDSLGSDCGDCDLCLRACPTGALCSPYTLDAKKCISYITQSRDLLYNQNKKIGKNIYGCDVCQNVCPHNKTAEYSRHGDFIPHDWNSYPDAVDILQMDNKSFDKTFKKTSAGWRGKKNLQRNAIIALGNSGIKEAAQYIIKMLDDSRKDIRETSAYALYNLLGEDSKTLLREYIFKEKDEEIKDIINKLID